MYNHAIDIEGGGHGLLPTLGVKPYQT